LRLRFSLIDGAMGAEWTPEADFEGYAGVIHGGLVSTVLDEAMAKIVSATVGKALTAELRVRFRRTVASGSTVEVRGWIESRERRMIRTEAALCSLDGEELAHGWGTFLAVK
jgi:acyl-coenzyme A thioesterase PaaI-like protein